MTGMDVLCIVQARTSSTRLPGKVLKPVLGEPMLARQIERIGRAARIDAVTIATSDQPADDPIAALCADLAIDCFRGSLDNVLERFHGAAARHRPRNVVRLTADCPLIDPAILDRIVALHVAGAYEYSSNVEPRRTFPRGLDVEVFTNAMLERAWQIASTDYEREHVTTYMRTGPDVRRGSLQDPTDRSMMRWTVDFPEDYDFVCRIFEALHPANPAFGFDDIAHLLRAHPEIAALNAMHPA